MILAQQVHCTSTTSKFHDTSTTNTFHTLFQGSKSELSITAHLNSDVQQQLFNWKCIHNGTHNPTSLAQPFTLACTALHVGSLSISLMSEINKLIQLTLLAFRTTTQCDINKNNSSIFI